MAMGLCAESHAAIYGRWFNGSDRMEAIESILTVGWVCDGVLLKGSMVLDGYMST